MGLNTLKDCLEKRGSDWVNKLLSDEVIITEKLDVFRFTFEKQGDELIFYKKDNTPINLIERTLTTIWEDALTEIPIICSDINIPEGHRFGVAYTPIERPLRLPYTNIPKYILTDVTIRKDNKVIESLDYIEVTAWAGLLCLGRPPIIFKGILSEEQKNYLIKYGSENYDDIHEKSMSEFVSENIATIYSKEKTIEGIIIQNKDNIIQIPSYEFNILNEAYENQYNTPRDYYDIFIMNLNSIMDDYSFPVLESETTDEKYIEIVNDIFEKFINKFSNQYTDESIDVKYLTPPQYGNYGKLNKKFIKDRKILSLLNSDINESIYKIILSSFRKYKKEYGLLNEATTQKFNTYVFLINNLINTNDDNSIIETAINESRSENIVVKELTKRKINDIDNMRVIASIQAAFDPEALNVEKGKTKCAVYITQLQPFSNAQFENIKMISKQYDVPIVIMSIGNDKTIKGEKFKVSDNIAKSIMKSIVDSNKEIVSAYSLLDSWSLYEIFERCRPQYEPVLIVTDKGKSSEIGIQLYFEEEVMGGRIGVHKEFNIAEMDIEDLLQTFRTIEDGDAGKFMELTPQCIHSFYDNIINEYKIWRGSILVNV